MVTASLNTLRTLTEAGAQPVNTSATASPTPTPRAPLGIASGRSEILHSESSGTTAPDYLAIFVEQSWNRKQSLSPPDHVIIPVAPSGAGAGSLIQAPGITSEDVLPAASTSFSTADVESKIFHLLQSASEHYSYLPMHFFEFVLSIPPEHFLTKVQALFSEEDLNKVSSRPRIFFKKLQTLSKSELSSFIENLPEGYKALLSNAEFLKFAATEENLNFRRILQLAYLTRISSSTDSGSLPFSEKTGEIFADATNKRVTADRWLTAGMAVTTGLTLVPFCSMIPPVAAWISASVSNLLVYNTVMMFNAGLTNGFNYVGTGTFPDRQTTAASKGDQYAKNMEKVFEDISCYLVEFSLAKSGREILIAPLLNIQEIYKKMIGAFLPKDVDSFHQFAQRCCSNLSAARVSVLEGALSEEASSQIRSAYLTASLMKDIKALTAVSATASAASISLVA